MNDISQPDAQQRMTKEEINKCPVLRYDGPVTVVRNRDTLGKAIRELEKETLLGFDTETRPTYKKGESYPPALLQLAGEKKVFIFQLQHIGLPDGLCRILADSDVVKAGVAPGRDVIELHTLAEFTPAGFVDLGELAREKGLMNYGLRGLAAVVLGIRIPKSARTSNWAKDTLTPAQIRYAATDAWIGREIYIKWTR